MHPYLGYPHVASFLFVFLGGCPCMELDDQLRSPLDSGDRKSWPLGVVPSHRRLLQKCHPSTYFNWIVRARVGLCVARTASPLARTKRSSKSIDIRRGGTLLACQPYCAEEGLVGQASTLPQRLGLHDALRRNDHQAKCICVEHPFVVEHTDES